MQVFASQRFAIEKVRSDIRLKRLLSRRARPPSLLLQDWLDGVFRRSHRWSDQDAKDISLTHHEKLLASQGDLRATIRLQRNFVAE